MRRRANEPAVADDHLQGVVLEELRAARNYRRWIGDLVEPWLGGDPLEVGSGVGDYAAELAARARRVTASEAEPRRLAELRRRFADDDLVSVRRLQAPAKEEGDHTAVFAVNVLEHIADDVGALRSFSRLVRTGGNVVIFVPAFPVAMSRFDRDIGHFRRYTRRTLRRTMEEAGLDVCTLHYVNAPGLLAWILLVRCLGVRPGDGRLLRVYDRLVVPVLRRVEAWIRPPFGQSLFAVGRVTA